MRLPPSQTPFECSGHVLVWGHKVIHTMLIKRGKCLGLLIQKWTLTEKCVSQKFYGWKTRPESALVVCFKIKAEQNIMAFDYAQKDMKMNLREQQHRFKRTSVWPPRANTFMKKSHGKHFLISHVWFLMACATKSSRASNMFVVFALLCTSNVAAEQGQARCILSLLMIFIFC